MKREITARVLLQEPRRVTKPVFSQIRERWSELDLTPRNALGIHQIHAFKEVL